MVVHLLTRHATLFGQAFLVNGHIIGKNATGVAHDNIEHALLGRVEVIDAIKFVAPHKEDDARGVFVLQTEMYVPGLCEQIKRTDQQHGKMFEHVAEAFHVEVESAPLGLAFGYLEKRGQIGIHAPYICAVGKCLCQVH